MHSAVRNVMRLFDRIKDFEKRVLARQPDARRADHEALLRGALAARATARAVRPAHGRGAVVRSEMTRAPFKRPGPAYR